MDGISTLNTAALTGESLPRDVSAGDEIISGCINMTGVLKVRTTKAFGESTVSKILELVENSSGHKSRSESFISRFAKVYTPAVCYSALALAILPPLALTVSGADADWGTWVYRALTFLVISCPCALVISIPLSFFAGHRRRGQGGRAHQGLQLPRGPLPDARPSCSTRPARSRRACLRSAPCITARWRRKSCSNTRRLPSARPRTPSARACKRPAGGALDRCRVTDIQEHSGRGVTAVVDGVTVAAGNGKLMEELGVVWHECHSVGTIVHIAVNGEYAGHIVISDVEKPHSRDAIAALKAAGVTKTVMLTGDIQKVADYVARDLGRGRGPRGAAARR